MPGACLSLQVGCLLLYLLQTLRKACKLLCSGAGLLMSRPPDALARPCFSALLRVRCINAANAAGRVAAGFANANFEKSVCHSCLRQRRLYCPCCPATLLSCYCVRLKQHNTLRQCTRTRG